MSDEKDIIAVIPGPGPGKKTTRQWMAELSDMDRMCECPVCHEAVRYGDMIWLNGQCTCPPCYEHKRRELDRNVTETRYARRCPDCGTMVIDGRNCPHCKEKGDSHVLK